MLFRSILVGDRVPIRVIDVGTGTVAGVAPRATIRFEQTGINLKVTPHVTANRQVLMEVHAERSNVKPASVDIGFTFQTQQGTIRSWSTTVKRRSSAASR